MIYLSLGSNQGNRLHYLRKGVVALKECGFRIEQESIVLETKALLPLNAPQSWDVPYFNMVVGGTTDKNFSQLMSDLHLIELACGRDTQHIKWAPRQLDIDILLWHDEIIDNDNLKVPHPELLSRTFLVHLLAMLNAPYIWHKPKCRYFGMNLGQIAHETVDLSDCFIRSLVLNPKLVGIVNVTPDSFTDGGLYLDSDSALQRVMTLSEEGACMIDIGAQSTRPNAVMIGAEEELRRVRPLFKKLQEYKQSGYDLAVSIDSFLPEVIYEVLSEYPTAWVNDQKCSLDDHTLRFIANSGSSIIVMHSLSIPHNRDYCIDFTQEPINCVLDWANKITKRLLDCGFSQEKIILDPGIGFGKSIYQNLSLFRTLEQLKSLGHPILVGHSKKSYMTSFTHLAPSMRDQETLAVSATLHELGIDYLRIHDVATHQRFFTAKQAVFSKSNY